MKLKLTITFLIIVLIICSIIIVTGFIFNLKYVEITTNPYENSQKYKNELEKINEYNQEILKDLEYQMKNSDDVNISQINDEIDVINKVINENKLELEEIFTKLSQIESNP